MISGACFQAAATCGNLSCVFGLHTGQSRDGGPVTPVLTV